MPRTLGAQSRSSGRTCSNRTERPPSVACQRDERGGSTRARVYASPVRKTPAEGGALVTKVPGMVSAARHAFLMLVALTRRNQPRQGGPCIPHARGANPLMRQNKCQCSLPGRLLICQLLRRRRLRRIERFDPVRRGIFGRAWTVNHTLTSSSRDLAHGPREAAASTLRAHENPQRELLRDRRPRAPDRPRPAASPRQALFRRARGAWHSPPEEAHVSEGKVNRSRLGDGGELAGSLTARKTIGQILPDFKPQARVDGG